MDNSFYVKEEIYFQKSNVSIKVWIISIRVLICSQETHFHRKIIVAKGNKFSISTISGKKKKKRKHISSLLLLSLKRQLLIVQHIGI